MQTIPVANPLRQYQSCRRDIDEAIHEVLSSGHYVLGTQCQAFEQEFANVVGVSHCASLASGTDAISIGLRALGVGFGDEVITSAHTANATVSAIELVGATAVLADIEQESRCLCPSSVKKLLGPQTKAIVVVHIYGQPANIHKIAEIASENSLALIEDCAQAHGAQIRGQHVGSFADIGAFSFYPTKILGALGDAGAVVCKDELLFEKLRMLRQYGWREKFFSEIKGANSRLDEIQAAVLRCKLKRMSSWHQRRLEIAAQYDAACARSSLYPPPRNPQQTHAFHLYVLETKKRALLRQHLSAYGVESAIHYPTPIHLQPAYVGKIKTASCLQKTEELYKRILSIPLYAELSDEEVATVCTALGEWKE